MAKGIEFTGMKGRGAEISLDLDLGVAIIKVDLNSVGEESSTGKTLVCATGYETFQFNGKRHSLRMNYLQNKSKAELQSKNTDLANQVAALQAKLDAK